MKALLSAVLLLLTPSLAAALPFMPDTIGWTVLETRLIGTGADGTTNTACINCEDLDPANDLTVTAVFGDGGGYGGFAYAIGSVTMTGYLPSIRDADLTIEADIRMTLQLTNAPPWEIAEYPLPSVHYGTLYGFLLGMGENAELMGFDFVEDGMGGSIDSATFKSAIGEDFWSVNPNATSFGFGLNGEVHWQGGTYAPEVTAVPEPTTLLLLGSGLIGAEWKRRRLFQFLKGAQP